MMRLGLAVALFLLATPSWAQHRHETSEMKPASLMPGFSNHHHPVKTGNPEAQRFFDQGIALVYAFNHEEAARAFRRAAALDPQMAMAHWGIALAVGPNYNEPTIDLDRMKAAVDAMEKASQLAANGRNKRKHISPRSRSVLREIRIRMGNDSAVLTRMRWAKFIGVSRMISMRRRSTPTAS
jgi:hypothetical protein